MLKFLLIISLFFLVACSGPGADSGFAPGVVTTPVTLPAATPLNHIKYGELVTTSNGWIVSNDSADPVEHKTLSNGWTVEVKYE